MAGNSNRGSVKPDFASIGGIVLAIGGILAGLTLEGGSVRDVAQVTAAMIVLGGTLGAVMLTTPTHVLLGAFKKLPMIFLSESSSPGAIIEEIIQYASKARREGIVSLENEANQAQDPFLRKALNLAVDGTDLQQIRNIMELEISMLDQHGEAEAKVFEAAGGYAPTVGIIGAVLGLIQVMKNLANIDEVGRGIAVAFVATVYGVGSANFFFLPAANKLKSRVHAMVQNRELMLEGVISIIEGLNPKLIRTKLEAYDPGGSKPGPTKSKASEAAGRAAAAEI